MVCVHRPHEGGFPRRNGVDSVAKYAGPEYDFLQQPQEGRPITKDQGEKIIDLVLKIANFGDLVDVKYSRGIPKSFNTDLLDFVKNTLSKDEATGETEETIKLEGREKLMPEHSSCRAGCTGLCVGSCINHCNGCTSCTASCGGECSHSCKGQCTSSSGSLKSN